MNENDLILENQLSFVMYACSKETIKHYKPYLDKVDLTYTQYITMLVLWNEEKLTVKQLGKRLYLDSGTMTPIIKKLEMKGFVERIRDKKDERTVWVSVTEQGYELKNRVKGIPEKVLEETGVPISEAIEIRETLKSILDRVNVKK